MIHHDPDLFYETYITINEHNRRQTHYLSSIVIFFYLFLSDTKSFFVTSSASSLIMISLLSLSECIKRSWLSWSLEKIKLIAIVNWIFHVSDFLRLFMISFKYGLILLRYSSNDSVFLLPLLLYLI